jgi:hypothetical protein
MADVATYVRIFEAEPTDDFVTKRTAAVKDLAARLIKDNNIDALVGVSNSIALACTEGQEMPEALASLTEASLKSQSTSFIRDGNEMQILVTAMLALDSQLLTAKPSLRSLSVYDVLALTSWSALSFQSARPEPKLEALRQELERDARSLCLSSASQSRTRVNIGDFKLEKLADDLSDLSAKLKPVVEGPLHALRNNAVLDREEIDFLWWALSDYSDLMDEQRSALSPAVAALAAGLDGSKILRRPPADAHRHLVLRHVRDSQALSLDELLTALGTARERLSAVSESHLVEKFPAVFPLMAALRTGVANGGGATRRPLAEWAGRALLEGGTLRVVGLLPEAKI